MPNKSKLDIIRYPEERQLYDELSSSLAAETIYSLIAKTGGAGCNEWLSKEKAVKYTKITPSLSRLYGLTREVLTRLGMCTSNIEFHISSSPGFKAKSLNYISGADEKSLVVLTADLIESLIDDELRAVLAHELAHIYYGHHRLQICFDWIDFEQKKNRLFAIKNLYEHWRQLAEISADRAKLLVVDTPRSALSSLYKHILRNLCQEDYDAHLCEQLNFARDSDFSEFSDQTHPPIQLRALALDYLIRSRFLATLKTGHIQPVFDDSRKTVEQLTCKLKISPYHDEAKFFEYLFLLAAGHYLVACDVKIHLQEVRRLRDILAGLIFSPDLHLDDLAEKSRALALLATIGEAIHTRHPPQQKKRIFELLCSLTMEDGRIAEEEKAALAEISNALHLEEETAARILLNTIREEFYPSVV